MMASTITAQMLVRRFSGRAACSSSRGFARLTPVCMGRRSAKIAGRKEKQDAAKTKLYGKFGKVSQARARASECRPRAIHAQ